MQRNTLTRKAEATKTKSTAGRLMARSGIEAVNATERLICGEGAVDVASVAQGLSLAGQRAATLLADGRSQPPARMAARSTAAWVHHQLGGGHTVVGGSMTFELDAGDAQQAVDHCLVAHRLADLLGRPGMCTLDPVIAEGLHLLRIPSETMVADLLGKDAGSAAKHDVLAAAAEAFQAVEKLTGRRSAVVNPYRMDGAEYLLVCTGSAARQAFRAADQLREAGIACGVASVMLTHPFPEEEVRAFIGKIKNIAVEDSLRTALRSALNDELSAMLRPIEVVDASTIAGAFGLKFEQKDPQATTSDASVLIGIAPGGAWSDRLLLDAAGLLGRLVDFTLDRPPHRLPGMSALAVGAGSLKEGVDLLLAVDPSLLRADGKILEQVREGGMLLLGGSSDAAVEIGSALGEERLRQIARRNLKINCFDLAAAANHEEASAETTRTLLLGALLAAGDEIAGPIGYQGKVVPYITAAKDEPDLTEQFIELLHEGAAALQAVDPASMEEPEAQEEEDFRPPQTLPMMPDPSGEETEEDWRGELRRFYLTGVGAYSAAEPLAALPLTPAGLGPLAEVDRKWRDYPLVLTDDSGVTSLTELIDITLEDIGQSGIETPILKEHRGRLSRAAGRMLEGRGLIPFREVLDEACERLGDELDLSEAGEADLEEEIYRLKARLPHAGSIVGLSRETLLRLYETAVRNERGPQAAFREEIVKRIAQMEDLLLADKAYSAEGSSTAAVAAAIGGADETFIDVEALASSLPARRGSKGLEPARRRRIEKCLATMQGYLEMAKEQPPLILLHHGQPYIEAPPDARVVEHPDGLEAAIGLFDGLAARMAEVFRAIRVARFEHRGAYDPGRHDALLARFDWHAFDEDELSLLPPIVVMESGRRLRGWAAASLSALLRSGRPIHVLAVECVADAHCHEGAEGLVDINPGFGFFAIAHREAFVLQSTLAYPGHLIDGLKRMMKVPRPAITLVAEPAWESPVSPWLQLAAAHSGRDTPSFGYDADAGLTWAECFDLSGNPQPETAWPVRETKITNAAGDEQTLEEAFTFVHAAALDPVYRGHFRVIPTEAWNDDQLEISSFLAAAEDRDRKVPYIWIVGRDGRLARAVMTQALIFACRDRRRAWRILQELGGADNEYARRAAEAARQQALAEADVARAELETAHNEEVEQARSTAAGEAMERLVNVLMNEDALASMAPAAGIAPAAGPVVQPASAEAIEEAPAEQAAEAEEEEDTISFADPYITSALCTTCNECTNLNNRMFQYNANKQAVVADAKAGTFAELVKAAEKCPARCIHPGAPRDDDDTATEDLIEKAAQFN